MKLVFETSNEGISISLGGNECERLIPDAAISQLAPKKSYVYGHFDERKVAFYIGKGTGRRAWDQDRHPMWHRYVSTRLNGKYSVVILQDNLTPKQAEQVESAWIAQESETLVNWVNMSRPLDLEALNKYNQLRAATLGLVARAKQIEKENPSEAIAIYYCALEQLSNYAGIQFELGLIGQLIDEEIEEKGMRGELQILDRLTICLGRTERHTEAKQAVDKYFVTYRADRMLAMAAKVTKRVGVIMQDCG
jgi:hypothetical protein